MCVQLVDQQDCSLQAANVDELHANGKAVAAREAARRAAEAELRASCTFRPCLAKVHAARGHETRANAACQQWAQRSG